MKGLGDELLQALESMIDMTHCYAFSSPPIPDSTYADGKGWTNSPPGQTEALPSHNRLDQAIAESAIDNFLNRILDPAPVTPLQARYTSADLRILSMMSYFHAHLGSSTWDFDEPLLAKQPWQNELGAGFEHVILIGEGSGAVMEEDLSLALNGSIVALLETDMSLEGPFYEQGRGYPALDRSNLLGLALIRGIDMTSTIPRLQILTPVDPETLGKAKIIVKNGALELPTCGMLDWRQEGAIDGGLAGSKWEEVPFFDVSRVDVVGGNKRRFRKNLMRKGM